MDKLLFCFIILFCLVNNSLADRTTEDPIEIGGGARPLSMGGAFTAVADDPNALFANPSGLAKIESWMLTGTRIVLPHTGTYYSIAGGGFSSPYGYFGLGFVGSGIGGVDVGGGVLADYVDNVLFFSYAAPLEKFPVKLDYIENTDIGLNLKVFNKGFTAGLSGGGTGLNIDLGLKYHYNDWVTFAFLRRNIIPAAWGGALNWNDGSQENLPSNTTLGAALSFFDKKLTTALDVKIPYAGYLPIIYYLGAEYKTNQYFSFRVGANQKIGSFNGAPTSTSVTLGLGLNYHGFVIDYAYHPYYTEFSDSVISTVSISYLPPVIEVSPPLLPEKSKPLIVVSQPKNETIVNQPDLEIIGSVDIEKVRRAEVDNVELEWDESGNFQTRVKLSIGRNALVVRGFGKDGEILDFVKLKVLRLVSFVDVPAGYWAGEQIATIATLGLISGYPDGSFRPEGNITRAEMATILALASGERISGQPISFNDLPATHWASQYIALAAEKGWVTGYPDGSYKPAANITRAEGIVIISRFAGIDKIPYVDEFTDLPSYHWSADFVAGAKAAGLLDYLANAPFEPNRLLTRAEVAEILYRTEYIKRQKAELFDFSRGY